MALSYCYCCVPSSISFASVVLTFNASLSALAPSPLISLSVSLLVESNVMSFLIFVLLFRHTSQVQCCQRRVDLQCLAQCTCSFIADLVACFVVDGDLMSMLNFVLLFRHTSQVQCCQRRVDFQCFTQCTCSFITDLVACFVPCSLCAVLLDFVFLFLNTFEFHCCQSCVDLQCLAQRACSFSGVCVGNCCWYRALLVA